MDTNIFYRLILKSTSNKFISLLSNKTVVSCEMPILTLLIFILLQNDLLFPTTLRKLQ